MDAIKKTTVIMTTFLLCLSCSRKETTGNYLEDQTIAFDEFEEETSSFPPKYFKNASYFCLDAGDDKFMLAEIDKMVCSGGNYYLFDSIMKKIAVFDSTGHVVAVLSRRGRGPQEYLNITDFDINYSGNITLVDGQKKTLMEYRKDGTFVSSTELPFPISKLACLPDGGFLFSVAAWNTGKYEGTELISCDKDLNVKSRLLDYPDNKDKNFLFPPRGFSAMGDGFIFQEAIDDHLYILDCNGDMSSRVTIDLGDGCVPDRCVEDIEANLSTINKYSFLTLTFGMDGNFILGGIRRQGEYLNFIADTKAETLYFSSITENGIKYLGTFGTKSYWQLLPGLDTECFSLSSDEINAIENGSIVLAVVDSAN